MKELKSRKLFALLREAGLDDCPIRPHLDELMLQSIGTTSATRQALKVYHELLQAKEKRRSDKGKEV